jgi:hypothetical protein
MVEKRTTHISSLKSYHDTIEIKEGVGVLARLEPLVQFKNLFLCTLVMIWRREECVFLFALPMTDGLKVNDAYLSIL